MDAFSLLRYWRSNGGAHDSPNNANLTASTTIVTAVSTQTSDTEGEEEHDNNDHGPFFDLEFSLPEEETKNGETENGVVSEDDDDESDGSESENEVENVVVSVSPSDDLFFKGGFVPVDKTTSETDLKATESQSRVSLMKSATKLRVMMLKFNMKSNSKDEQNKLGQIRENDVEQVPIVSLFKRHNSSKLQKKRPNDVESVSDEEKKFSKEAMQRYLRKVKPLYVRVSKRYGEKLKFSSQLKQTSAPSPSPSPSSTTEVQKKSPVSKDSNLEASEAPLLTSNGKGLKQGNLPAGLRVVCKHLGKSRSASTAVVAASPQRTMTSKRRDDSLLQQQDGIQSAILHCKRSFKASRDSDCSSSLSSESVPANISNSSSEAAETVEMKNGNDSQKAGN